MSFNKKSIIYQDKIVFEKVVMPAQFKRIPKLFQEDETCFLFMSKGTFHFRTPTRVLVLKEDDAILAKCGNYFIEEIYTETDNEFDFITVYGAYFYPEIIKRCFQTDLSIKSLQNNYDIAEVSVEPLMKTFIESIDYLLDNPSIADNDYILNKIKELLLLLSKSDSSKSINEFVSSLFTPFEYKFQEIIQNNIFSNLNLNEMAKLCNYSLSTFKRKFKLHYSESPSKYFLNKKLDKSTELLQLNSISISDIAFECGFENVSSFNRVFKKRFGKSPSKYLLD